MLIFLYGDNSYKSREKLNEIIERHQKIHKSGLNLKVFDWDEKTLSFEDFKNQIQQTSMFKEKKLLVLKNSFSDEDFKKNLLENKKIILKSQDIIVFFEEGKVLESDWLTKFLKKQGKFQKSDILKQAALKKWAREKFEENGLLIEENGLSGLIGAVGENPWRLAAEIEKISSYKEKGTVRLPDINLLVKPEIETEIFKTIEAISQKNKGKALIFLKKHLEAGESPFYLFSMIAFGLRNLILAKNSKNADVLEKKMAMHPYTIKKSKEAAVRFSFEELKKIYQKLFLTDLRIKTGKISPEEGIKSFVLEI